MSMIIHDMIVIKTRNSIYSIRVSEDGFIVEKIKAISMESKSVNVGDKFIGPNLHIKKGEKLIMFDKQKTILVTSPILEIESKKNSVPMIAVEEKKYRE